MNGSANQGHENEPPFIKGLLAIGSDSARDAQTAARAAADYLDAQPATTDDLARYFQGEGDLIEVIAGLAGFVVLRDGLTVQQALDRLANQDPSLVASPIHALAPAWHRVMGGPDYTEEGSLEDVALPQGAHDRVIAMVDTGISEYLPPWMGASVQFDALDIETVADDGASHGTFVASVIRRASPSHRVSIAKAGAFEPMHKHGGAPPTTEAHIALAIDRLLRRHEKDDAVEALNISLGGYALDPRARQPMVLLAESLDRWYERYPRCTTVFAAAGNEPESAPVFPAAFRRVRGVAASDDPSTRNQLVWDASGQPASPPYRHWVDDVAHGVHVTGLSGRDESHTITWSGSSFASPIAAASQVSGSTPDVVSGIAYWPDKV